MLVVVYCAGKTWRGFPGLCNLVLQVLGVVGLLYDAWLIVTLWISVSYDMEGSPDRV